MLLLYPPRIYILFASRPLNGQKKSAPRPPIVQNIIRFIVFAFNLSPAPPPEQQTGSIATSAPGGLKAPEGIATAERLPRGVALRAKHRRQGHGREKIARPRKKNCKAAEIKLQGRREKHSSTPLEKLPAGRTEKPSVPKNKQHTKGTDKRMARFPPIPLPTDAYI